MKNNKNRAFLKWAGGKYALIEAIHRRLPEGKRLVEPFVGAGSVFLNSDFDHYLLNDINPDLINLYNIVKHQSQEYIKDSQALFTAIGNTPETYYATREKFNQSTDSYERAVLFLYLNRHCYNGLCRYNLSGKFNVPFGRYKGPYFPEKELNHFAEKAQKASFVCLPFQEVFTQLKTGDVVYCDPPYAPLTPTSSFTQYAKNGFGAHEQKALAECALKTQHQHNLPVVISNHDTSFTREIYQGAKLSKLKVNRYISQKGNKRGKVSELIATYIP